MQEKSEIEELWVGSTDNAALLRVNGAIVETIIYCASCGNKAIFENECDPCLVCGYRECE